jgi:two-component system, OmpR family, sensor histidine kinase VicK
VPRNKYYYMSTSNGADEHKIASSATDDANVENLKGQSIQIIANVQKIKQMYLSLIRNAQREVLLIFPTTNAIRREEGVSVFAELLRASQHGVTIRILTPEDDFIRAKLNELRTAGIVVRQIETPAEAKFKLLIVDKKFSLVIETRDDTRGTFEQAIGLATFSNSEPTVMPYVTIFGSFWRETDLYDRARQADKIKDDFVNVAAHELRNPISPIMAGGDFAMEDVRKLREGKVDQQTLDSLTDNINMIMRNASKLYKLSEDILQVSKIESGTFTLNIERVELKLLLELAIQDARKRIENEKKPVDIRLDCRLNNNAKGKFALFCDNSKINQVLYNLIDNAIRFTDQGSVTVSAALYNPAELIVRVEDSGKGIHPEIKDKLFVKFASKSDVGTGLGLYLSKNIVNAHGGRIWAANNPSGVGATFSFTLPTDLQPITLQKHSLAEMLEQSSSNNIDKYAREGTMRETSVTEQ